MKTILLALLLLPTTLFADSVTSGVGLLIPSTGVIDRTRRLDDKYNENFRIISSSLTYALQNLGVSGAILSIYDSANTFQGNATTIRFNTNLSVSMTGSTATVSASGSGGGAVGNSTVTVTLFHSGGPVFLATSPFVAIDGLGGTPVIVSTFHAFRLQAYTMFPSTVAVTKFQVVKTTALHINANVSNWGPQVHSSTGAYYGVPISTSIPFYPTEGYALHIDSTPVSGDNPRTYGLRADGWFDPQ